MSARPRSYERRLQEWAVYCGLFLSTLDTGIVTVALKPIANSFEVSLPVVGLTVTFYLFALVAVLVPGGWLGDRFGSERTLAMGFAIFGVASVVCSGASTIVQLVGGRAMQGIGAALIQGNALGYVAKQPADRRLHMSTLMTAAISVGPILGPSLGGGLLELGGWPWLFLVNIPFCVIGFAIAWRGQNRVGDLSAQRIDLKEFTIFAVLVALAAWLLYSIDAGTGEGQVIGSAFSLVVVGVGFSIYEWRQQFPLIPVASLAKRTGAFIIFGAFVFGYTAGVFFAAAPVLLIGSLKLDVSIVGIVTSAAPVGLFIGAMLRKAAGTRIGDLRAMQVGSMLMMAALVMFVVLPVTHNAGIFAGIAALYGVGGGIFQVSNIKSAPRVTPDRAATAGSLLRLFQNLGIALGATMALYLLPSSGEATIWSATSSMILETSAGTVLLLLIFSIWQRDAAYE